MFDCSRLTFQQMADVVRAIREELKNRNPIGVNFYTGALSQAIADLETIHQAELSNPTCDGAGLPPQYMIEHSPYGDQKWLLWEDGYYEGHRLVRNRLLGEFDTREEVDTRLKSLQVPSV